MMTTFLLKMETLRLWSYNSTSSSGKYVYMTNITAPNNGEIFIVKATGKAEGITLPFTNIKFHVVKQNPHKLFSLQFTKNEIWHTVSASKNGVTAYKDAPTWFRVLELYSPNRPYVVFESSEKNEDGDKLYLSSDGSGDMKLKVWNKSVREPPRTTGEVDPALLFRVIAGP
ncbi:Hypothetical predicted protein [Paramuricea clavata]|uniref:Uncharacterized protein n=1 Tax=Paramuricea clavata TaxID=317549 RepID=A0A6S7IMK4_PARCT|nr:Hypothetical predicted protein [Paramuricea clavata]